MAVVIYDHLISTNLRPRYAKKILYIHSVFNKFFRPICVLAPVVDLPLLNQGKGYDMLVTGHMLQ